MHVERCIAREGLRGHAFSPGAFFGKGDASGEVGHRRHGPGHGKNVFFQRHDSLHLGVAGVQKRNVEGEFKGSRAATLTALKAVLQVTADGAGGHITQHGAEIGFGMAPHFKKDIVSRCEIRNAGRGVFNRHAHCAGGVRHNRHRSALKADGALNVRQNRPLRSRFKPAVGGLHVIGHVVNGPVFHVAFNEKLSLGSGRRPRVVV